MILYGLKLWTSNSEAAFNAATDLCGSKKFDFVELYHNPEQPLDYAKLGVLKSFEVDIHNDNNHGWHEFALGDEQLKIWRGTLALADFFSSKSVVVHPGMSKSFEFFEENLRKIDDPRILIENMPGFYTTGMPTWGRAMSELRQIVTLKPICFDFEKAIKSAAFQKIDYKNFIRDCLTEFQPRYFHISGGDKNSPIDQHEDLSSVNFDVGWIGQQLEDISAGSDARLVFETPKRGDDLENDVRNLEYFKATLNPKP